LYGRAADPTGLRHLGHVLSLVVEGLADHAPRDRLADLDGKFFEFRELGSPGHPLNPVDLVKEVFRDPRDEVLLVVDGGGGIR
jgi:hypothetical protein